MHRVIVVCAVSGLATMVHAATPVEIPYRGVLEQNGTPYDVAVNLTFDLYATPTGGTSLWTEVHTSVPVQSGNFSVSLGSVTPIPVALLRDYAELYLGIEVNGSPLAGRQRLLAVPYARVAETPPGMISPFAAATPPAGWLLCDGAGLSSADYPELFAVLGTTWGDGTSNCAATCDFNLPDFRGRVPLGQDGPANRVPDVAADTVGGGAGVPSLSAPPNHSHSINPHGHRVYAACSTGDLCWDGSDGLARGRCGTCGMVDWLLENSAAMSTNVAGAGATVTNMPPYATVLYIIKY